MRILGQTSQDPRDVVGPAVKVDVYYDRHGFRTWVARWMDANDNQVGECVYAHTKKQAVAALGEAPVEA